MKRCLSVALLCVIAVSALAQTRQLEHSDYARWSSVRNPILSRDGNWLAYNQTQYESDGVLYVKDTKSGKLIKIERGTGAAFTRDSSILTYSIAPSKAETAKAKKDKKPAPKAVNAYMELATGTTTTLENAASFKFADENGTWFAVQYAPAEGKKEYTIELRSPSAKKTVKLESVLDYALEKKARGVLVATEKDGLQWMDLKTEQKTLISNAKGSYANLTIDNTASQYAFVFEPKAEKDQKTTKVLKLWSKGKLTDYPQAQVPKDRTLALRQALLFSDDGKKLFFNVAAVQPEPVKKDDSGEETVSVDIWHYQDPLIQPEQLLDIYRTKNQVFQAVWLLSSNKLVTLATDEVPIVSIQAKGKTDWALAWTTKPYDVESTWHDDAKDVYRVSLNTGEKQLIAKRVDDYFVGSSTGRYAVWYDKGARNYFVADIIKGTSPVNVTKAIPTPLWNEQTDTPGTPGPWGAIGWTKDDKEFLINDKYDVWAVDPNGKEMPKCLTNGFGRDSRLYFRRQQLDADEEYIDPSKPFILTSLNEATLANGYYLGSLKGGNPVQLRVEDKLFGSFTKAKDADVVALTKQSFTDCPDLYLTDLSFKETSRVTDANPQQKEYGWGAAELTSWISNDGQTLKGILIKPANFDPNKKYPMVVEFYDKITYQLHLYTNPAPTSSAGVNESFYASRGYVVFKPDINFTVGYPGKSAVSAIVSGVLSVVNKGFVDPTRIAITGHSWGGYETAFIVTQTNLFACAVAGASVTNMTSAYSGIRWSSGKMRQFQYETGQSRIGGSLWENPLQYIENSPVFWADRVQTPILLLHNDKDGAVPFEQAIEYYGALRRLGKPCWLVNYNGEDHGIGKVVNKKDWTIRMQQFYDHYLKGAPAPVWLTEGVPAAKKGETFGLEVGR